ncbi:MAG: hypothetical protein AAFV37_00130 [Pseudomonadota bacterium]
MLQKRVSMAVLIAIAIETAAGLIWAGATLERIDTLEREAAESRPVAERLARVEAQLEAVNAQLDRIEMKIEARE